jgi:hypothetical protein
LNETPTTLNSMCKVYTGWRSDFGTFLKSDTTMGYIFLNFWLFKPNFVAIWADQVARAYMGLQVPHEQQPQILHESLKNLNFWSVVHGG